MVLKELKVKEYRRWTRPGKCYFDGIDIYYPIKLGCPTKFEAEIDGNETLDELVQEIARGILDQKVIKEDEKGPNAVNVFDKEHFVCFGQQIEADEYKLNRVDCLIDQENDMAVFLLEGNRYHGQRDGLDAHKGLFAIRREEKAIKGKLLCLHHTYGQDLLKYAEVQDVFRQFKVIMFKDKMIEYEFEFDGKTNTGHNFVNV